ncbi:MAG TPA: hypothetical protein P5287_01725 [bacterium]|nr:hypothetical protein [bacterium]
MKKVLAFLVVALCVVGVAGICLAGGDERPVKAVEPTVQCGHNDGTCGGEGCCHIHAKGGQHDSSHGQAMEQQCGVCGKNHGTALLDGACLMHNLGCFGTQLGNAAQTTVCCVLGFFKDAGRLWGLLG